MDLKLSKTLRGLCILHHTCRGGEQKTWMLSILQKLKTQNFKHLIRSPLTQSRVLLEENTIIKQCQESRLQSSCVVYFNSENLGLISEVVGGGEEFHFMYCFF